ncbi:MAG: tetratricopeptide repeat protein [Saprospiraceae bacterium]
MDKIEEAAEVKTSLLDSKKFDIKNYFEIAQLYSRLNDSDNAIKVISKIDDYLGYDRETELYKAHIYQSNREYDKAVNVLEKLENNFPDDIDIKQNLAIAYRMNGDDTKSESIYKQILDLDPTNKYALSYFSSHNSYKDNKKNYLKNLIPYLQNGDIDMDEKILTLAPYVQDVSPTVSYLEELKECAKTLLDIYPQNAKTNALYADILYNSSDDNESMKYYRKSLQYDKSNFMIWRQLMQLYSMYEMWSDLEELSSEAIDYYPNQALTYFYNARAKMYLKKYSEAHEMLSEAELYAGEKSKFLSEIKLVDAYTYFLENNQKKSNNILSQLDKDVIEQHPLYFELLGDIESKNGNEEKAMEYWEKSVKLGNTSSELKEKLKK